MRNRKPWVFARLRLFGWNVRLLTRGLQEKVEYGRGLRKGVRAAGQKELLRYGPTADRVKRGAASFGMIALRDSSFVPVDIASSRNSPNCGERLEAQGGTLLASHGPTLIAVNR